MISPGRREWQPLSPSQAERDCQPKPGATSTIGNYVYQAYASISQDPLGNSVDFLLGAFDGALHTIVPPIPFLGELPHIGPYFGHTTAFAIGSGVGVVGGVVGGLLIGNVAAGAGSPRPENRKNGRRKARPSSKSAASALADVRIVEGPAMPARDFRSDDRAQYCADRAVGHGG